jgi:hypothetical protein
MNYKVYFEKNANRGSFAINALAETADGVWTSSTNDFGMLEGVPDENIEYLDSILDNDSDVLDYHKID